ncbi:MAG: serine protease [Acidimicrobiaceae bacterium]|nr:serine protease [Acidimicrobiaceae bacterium]
MRSGLTPRRGRVSTLLAGTVALALGLAAVPMAARATDAAGTMEVHGTIALPSPARPAGCADTAGGSLGAVGADAASRVSSLIAGVHPGRVYALTADNGPWKDDFDVTFYRSVASCQSGEPALVSRNHSGNENSVVPAEAGAALVTLVSPSSKDAPFTYTELPDANPASLHLGRQRPTVIAVIEPVGPGYNGFSPYHYDFLGREHPWNTDASSANDLDFQADPGSYLPSYPGSEPIQLSLPTAGDQDVTGLAAGPDAAAWGRMHMTTSPAAPKLYRFPGTKVVGAINFDSEDAPGTASIYGENEAHGTKSASVAGGNIHGTCPECLFVLVGIRDSDHTGRSPEAALEWVASQPWIDVVTNSYHQSAREDYGDPIVGKVVPEDVRSQIPGVPQDGVHPFGRETAISRAAVQSGQTIVWAAGNGLDGAFGVPNFTYPSSQKGADWIVTVGAVSSTAQDQPLDGAGKPVDISSYGHGYPSAGDKFANGKSAHSGTSNATPVVAGTFAKVIQMGRDLLGDTAGGHKDGVVARGKPVPCRAAPATSVMARPCPLGDGVLTRAEVQSIVFDNVLPSSPRTLTATVPPAPKPPAVPTAPAVPATGPPANGTTSTPVETPVLYQGLSAPPVASYASEGHGIVYGHGDASRFVAEQRRFLDALLGLVTPYQRPPGERTWMTVDSKCRQRLYGTWTEGYYTGTDPAFDPTVDQPALALNAACTALPQDTIATLAPTAATVASALHG